MIDNFAHGGDILIAITAASVFAQIGIAFGVVLRSRRNKDLRSLSIGTTLSGLLAGVTEPILYGLILWYKRLIPIVLVSGAIGGAIIAIFDVRVTTFVLNNLFTIPVFKPMYGYILGIAIALIIGTILTFVFGFEAKNSEKPLEAKENTNNLQEGVSTMIFAPLSGEIVKLENVPDPVFSTEAMGKGIAIEPENDTVLFMWIVMIISRALSRGIERKVFTGIKMWLKQTAIA